MPSYLEFEVSLREITPRIWRRFLLRPPVTFHQLHEAIQAAGPWGNYHLWQFSEPGRPYRAIAGLPDDEFGEETPDAKRVKVASYFQRPGDRCLYRYDFGDDWEHDVVFVRSQDLPEVFRRRLLAGERAFPPEDCGSIPGYYECLAALGQRRPRKGESRPDSEELAERRTWLGDWNPDFVLEEARRAFDR